MTNDCKLSVILPAYCEEENLQMILPQLKSILLMTVDSSEILIIDTMVAMDHTSKVCFQNDVIYINRENGNSYGDAVRTGIKYARGEKIIFMDADGSHAPEFITHLYAHKDDYDVVIASRYIAGGATRNNVILVLMSLTINIIYSLVLNLKCRDVSNSYKLYNTKLLKNINLSCNNFDIVEEILFKLKRDNPNLRIKEIPFTFTKRMFGQTKRNLFLFILTYIYSLIKLRFGN
jgi:dolichol-phosphate mannosyltransferase